MGERVVNSHSVIGMESILVRVEAFRGGRI